MHAVCMSDWFGVATDTLPHPAHATPRADFPENCLQNFRVSIIIFDRAFFLCNEHANLQKTIEGRGKKGRGEKAYFPSSYELMQIYAPENAGRIINCS